MHSGKVGSASTWYGLIDHVSNDVLTNSQVSAGEEGIAVGSAAALIPEDVIFAQYRETGVFQQRGFKLSDFMNQLFANRKDLGRGRNMPVHYGSSKLNIVCSPFPPHRCNASYKPYTKLTLSASTPFRHPSRLSFHKQQARPTPSSSPTALPPPPLESCAPISAKVPPAKETFTLP